MGWAPLYPGSPWMLLIGLLILIVLIAVLVLLIVFLVRGYGGGHRQQPEVRPRRSSAREILDERLARGEIDTAEYQERLQALDGH